jgi:hypothetical protein
MLVASSCEEARNAAEHPTILRTSLYSKELSSSNVSNAETGKLRPMSQMQFAACFCCNRDCMAHKA